MDKKDIQSKLNIKSLGVLVAVAVIIIAMICGIAMFLSSDTKRLQRQLELGQRYLVELDYEQAVVEFEKAIEIDPMSVDAYLGLAEAYEGMGDIDMAIQVLEQGYEITGDERILEALTALMNIEESDNRVYSEAQNSPESRQENLVDNGLSAEDAVSMMYQAYYDKLIELQNQYGLCEDITEEADDDTWLEENRYLKGLCFAKLIDFDKDGVEELILAYNTGTAPNHYFSKNYCVEVWAYQDSNIQKVYSGEPIGDGEHGYSIYLVSYEGKLHLYNYIEEYDDRTSTSNIIDEWYGYDNNVFGILKQDVLTTVYADGKQTETFKVDNKKVTEQEWREDRITDIVGDYGLQNGGTTLDASIDELVSTFQALSDYLGVEWANTISYEKKSYLDSIWKRDLVGYWETVNYEASQSWATLTLYEDGVAELHMRNSVGFGTFEIEPDGSVMLFVSDEYEYNNAEVQWSYYMVDWQIQLTEGSHTREMVVTCVDDNGGTFPFYDSLALTRIYEDGTDYSSADKSIQYYKKIVN